MLFPFSPSAPSSLGNYFCSVMCLPHTHHSNIGMTKLIAKVPFIVLSALRLLNPSIILLTAALHLHNPISTSFCSAFGTHCWAWAVVLAWVSWAPTHTQLQKYMSEFTVRVNNAWGTEQLGSRTRKCEVIPISSSGFDVNVRIRAGIATASDSTLYNSDVIYFKLNISALL